MKAVVSLSSLVGVVSAVSWVFAAVPALRAESVRGATQPIFGRIYATDPATSDVDEQTYVEVSRATTAAGVPLVNLQYCSAGVCQPLGLRSGYTFEELRRAVTQNQLQFAGKLALDAVIVAAAGVIGGTAAAYLGAQWVLPGFRQLAMVTGFKWGFVTGIVATGVTVEWVDYLDPRSPYLNWNALQRVLDERTEFGSTEIAKWVDALDRALVLIDQR